LGILVLFNLLTPWQNHSEESLSILSEIRKEFQCKNKKIEDVTMLELLPMYDRSRRYLVVAHGIRQDVTFEGSFEDELFGLFAVDISFTKVLTVIDIFPTQRWSDWSVEIRKPIGQSIVLDCKGTTYGDQKLVKKYPKEILYDGEKRPFEQQPGSTQGVESP
jgi:hypothetical protein